MSQTSLSPRAAIAVGLLTAACGLPPILGGLGLIPIHAAEGTPAWLAVAAGIMFVLGGAALIVGYAVAGGTAADGSLLPGTPVGVQVLQYLLGLGMMTLLTAIFGWIAFGPGPRHFSAVVFLPFVTSHPDASERSGRVIFGVADVLMGAMLAALAFTGARRIFRSSRRRNEHEGHGVP